MFMGKFNQEVFNKILANEVDYSAVKDEDAADLIQSLCLIEPSKRLGLKNME